MYAQSIQLDRSEPLARRLLDRGKASTDPLVYAYGLGAWGVHQWDVGNIGEAYRFLSEADQIMRHDLSRREDNPVRYDLQLLIAGVLAQIAMLHGEVDTARVLFDKLEADAGDEPYGVTIWSALTAWTAAMVGDPAEALRAAERGIAVDPEFSFVVLATYQRLARCWALAVTGHDPAGAAAEAERIINANLVDPPQSCVSTWHGLLGEMRLAAGAPAEAAAAMDWRRRRRSESWFSRRPSRAGRRGLLAHATQNSCAWWRVGLVAVPSRQGRDSTARPGAAYPLAQPAGTC
ncbi:hypothetical protein Pth03_76460 [Planotetraspora thailandica]|uniref:Uncharacterized protein n=1 Tax=Planotetraspora thailandica TaxID=487172 RepID=A0A8J3Y1P9_9ACTN|nr:hypothetical protein [Planotetraspora thailandica]GII59257.1 hypothetical protein Pth03_76460 [Planotetraspora thailandica]